MRSNLSPSITRTWRLIALPSGRLEPGDLQIDQSLKVAERGNEEVDQPEKAHAVQLEELLATQRRKLFLVDGVVAAEVIAQLGEHRDLDLDLLQQLQRHPL